MTTNEKRNAYARQYYQNRKALDPTFNTGKTQPRSEAQWTWHLKRRYGITGDEFVVMFEEQGGQCKICGESLWDERHIDHCHTTGKVRGVLCQPCNHGLGMFKDSPKFLVSAAAYLAQARPEFYSANFKEIT